MTVTISTSTRLTTPSRAILTRRNTSRGNEDVEDGDVEAFEQSRRALPKNFIRPLPMQDRSGRGSKDLLSRSPVHADERDEIVYAAAQQAG
jgi:hypothetical protein